MVVASSETRIKVIMNLRRRALEGRKMPNVWKINVIVPIKKRVT